jgi:hypothetical protein
LRDCTFASKTTAYLIASGIPFFNGLVSLIGVLLGAFLAYQPTGCMWFYDNWRHGAIVEADIDEVLECLYYHHWDVYDGGWYLWFDCQYY